MSVLNILFGNRTPSGFSLSGMVEFSADLTLEETHERDATVTEHAIESGASVTDHVFLAPERLRLEGFVTDSGVAVLASDPGRTQSAFDTLDRAWKEREPVTVVTGYRTYRDMIITRLVLPRTRPDSMRFTIEMQHITIVSAATTEIAATTGASAGVGAPSAQTDADATAGRTDAGRQPTRESSEATTDAAESVRGQSILRGFF